MKKIFDQTFFRFLIAFFIILAVSFILMGVVSGFGK